MNVNGSSCNALDDLNHPGEHMSKDSAVRTFLAVRLPLELAATLHKKAIHRAGDEHTHDVRWVVPQQQHITLKFLGSSNIDQLDTLITRLEQGFSGCKMFDSMTGCFRFFPNGRKSRILALDMHSGQELKRLAAICEYAALQSGFQPERRNFYPHVTLGRFKSPRYVNHSQFFNLPSFRMTVAEVVLFQSEPSSDGKKYKALHVFPLQPLAISA